MTKDTADMLRRCRSLALAAMARASDAANAAPPAPLAVARSAPSQLDGQLAQVPEQLRNRLARTLATIERCNLDGSKQLPAATNAAMLAGPRRSIAASSVCVDS